MRDPAWYTSLSGKRINAVNSNGTPRFELREKQSSYTTGVSIVQLDSIFGLDQHCTVNYKAFTASILAL